MNDPTSLAFRTLRIVWTALAISVGIYAFVLWFVRWREGAAPPPQAPDPILLPALSAVATAVGVASIVLPRHLFRTGTDGMRRPRRGEALDPKLFASLVRRAFTPFVLGCALSEAVALFGFVLGFLGFSPLYVAPFFVVSWGLFAIRFPTESWVLSLLPE